MLALGKLLELTLTGREPSEKIQLCASGARLQWRIDGVLEVDPPAARDQGIDLLLSAGIHGDEVAPVEVLEHLLHDIASCRLQPAVRLLLVLGNPAGLRAGVRSVGYDLNRLFGGQQPAVSGPEALRSVELELQAELFFGRPQRRRLHYDLHTTLRPSQIERFALWPASAAPPTAEQIARLGHSGLQALLLQSGTVGTFCAFTGSRFDAEALTFEVSPQRPGAEPDLGRLERWLRALIEGREPIASEPAEPLRLFRIDREIVRRSSEFRLHLDGVPDNFAEVPPGRLLAEDGKGVSWWVNEPGTRLLFANPHARIGQRAGLLVVPVSLAEACA